MEAWLLLHTLPHVHPGDYHLTLAGWKDDTDPFLDYYFRLFETNGLSTTCSFIGPVLASDKDKAIVNSDAIILPS